MVTMPMRMVQGGHAKRNSAITKELNQDALVKDALANVSGAIPNRTGLVALVEYPIPPGNSVNANDTGPIAKSKNTIAHAP